MKKLTILLFLLFWVLFYTPSEILAVCPACTIAVGAGVGLSRWLGIDDTITGVWIGGLALSLSLWLNDWLIKKNYITRIKYYPIMIFIATYGFLLAPLWLMKIIGHPQNTILGVDKILFGTAFGSIIFLLSIFADKKIREIKGKQLFQFQKVVFPVVGLFIISIFLYLIT